MKKLQQFLVIITLNLTIILSSKPGGANDIACLSALINKRNNAEELIRAIKENNYNKVSKLLDTGTDINQILQLHIDISKTPLGLAIDLGEQGWHSFKRSRTPLGLAIDLGHMEIINLLLSYEQLNVNDSGSEKPPISIAILKKRPGIMIRLMKHNKTRKSDFGDHFFMAAYTKYKEGIRLLIDFIYTDYQDHSTLYEYNISMGLFEYAFQLAEYDQGSAKAIEMKKWIKSMKTQKMVKPIKTKMKKKKALGKKIRLEIL